MAKAKFPKKNNDTLPSNTFSQAGNPSVKLADLAPAALSTTEAVTEKMPEPARPEPANPEIRKTTRKPEIVKTESRSNLVPINLDDEIRRLAYLLSERRGFEAGHETEDWLAAEREVHQRYHQQSA